MTRAVARFAAKMLATATVADWLCLLKVLSTLVLALGDEKRTEKIFMKHFFSIMQNNLARANVIKLFTTVTYKFS